MGAALFPLGAPCAGPTLRGPLRAPPPPSTSDGGPTAPAHGAGHYPSSLRGPPYSLRGPPLGGRPIPLGGPMCWALSEGPSAGPPPPAPRTGAPRPTHKSDIWLKVEHVQANMLRLRTLLCSVRAQHREVSNLRSVFLSCVFASLDFHLAPWLVVESILCPRASLVAWARLLGTSYL